MMCPRNKTASQERGRQGKSKKAGHFLHGKNRCNLLHDMSLDKSLILAAFSQNYPVMAADETLD